MSVTVKQATAVIRFQQATHAAYSSNYTPPTHTRTCAHAFAHTLSFVYENCISTLLLC